MNIVHRIKQKMGMGASVGPGSAAILAAIGREMAAQRKIFLRYILAPDQFRVELAARDYAEIRPVGKIFRHELEEEAVRLARSRDMRLATGRVEVEIVVNKGLAEGAMQVHGSFSAAAETEENTAAEETGCFRLVIARGTSHEETLPLGSGSRLIGRGRDANIFPQVEDELMSRSHCLLTVDRDEIIVQDLDSANGVIVNNSERVDHARLQVGDTFLLGNTEFQILSWT